MKLQILGRQDLKFTKDGEGKLFHLSSSLPTNLSEIFRVQPEECGKQRPWKALAMFDKETWLMTIQVYGKEGLYSIYYSPTRNNVEPILFKDYVICDLNNRWLGSTGIGDAGEILYMPDHMFYKVGTAEIVSVSRSDIYPQDLDNTRLSTGGTMSRILPKNLWTSERASLSKIIQRMNTIVRSESSDWMQDLLFKNFGWEPSETFFHTGSNYSERYLEVDVIEKDGPGSGFFEFGVRIDSHLGLDYLTDILMCENKVLPKQIN